jgi:hypothetical protein
MEIMEHERVVLKTPIPGEGLQPGDVGVVALVYSDGLAYEVEFTSLDGQTAAVVTLEADQVRPVSRRDITHARTMSAG